MDNKIGDIIEFYTEHQVSDNISQRFFERLSTAVDDTEANTAFRKLWDKADSAYMDDEEKTLALNRFHKNNQIVKTKRTWSKWFNPWRVAAVATPLLLLTALYLTHNKVMSHQDSSPMAMLQAHAITGEERSLLLSDGTKVKLSPGSILLYPQDFKGKERKVFLAGEAFFEIKHDDKNPFLVNTSFFDITDLGTSFKVTAYADAEEVSTTVKSGKIELRLTDDNKCVYEMNPKDRFVYNVHTKESRMERVEDINNSTWKQAQIDLNDITLAEALHILERTYGKRFVLQSQRFTQTRITIHYNRGENLQNVMSIIADLIPGMKYQIQNDTIFIK